ncbi:MAG: 23S rRNA (guanosine(2251)-2'-O)-methyltransferase RlmB [Verrucomicrobiaceae bacterium]|nr:23S rRNA (guanosine(2251)-2'-O)-methyltransferase RlmB [Verrucomicrobiaceae bacterium]
MSRHRRSKTPGNRPREARANAHSSSSTGIARLSESDLFDRIAEVEDVLLLVLDGVQDPHNLGACLRSAEGAGVLAVIVPRHKASPVTETAVRVSCGGAMYVPVVSVANMARFLGRIREECGIRVVGTADESDCDLFESDLTGSLAIVLGAEGEGMRRLTKENCDTLIRIPMLGRVECLNVSNAAAVCLYESLRQREFG